MAVTIENTAPYEEFFRRSLLAMAQDALQTVQATETIPPRDVRAQAVHLLHLTLQRDETWPTARGLLLTLAPKMEQAGHREDWMPFLVQGIGASQQQQDGQAEAELTMQLALLEQLRGQFALAYQHFARAEALFGAMADAPNQARALNRMAYMACRLQRTKEAEALAARAAALVGPTHQESAATSQVLGEVALSLGDWPRAEEHYRRALAIWQLYGDSRHLARRLRDVGNALYYQGKYEAAAESYTQAIAAFGAVQDEVQQAVVRMNLGVIFLLGQQIDRSLQQFALAEPVLRRVHDIHHLAMLYTNQGIAYRQQEAWQKAERALRAGVEYQRKTGSVLHLVDSLIEFGSFQLARQEWVSAQEILAEAAHLVHNIASPTKRKYYQTKIESLWTALNEGEGTPSEIPSAIH